MNDQSYQGAKAMDGVLMLRASDRAFVEPTRKLRYNMAITLVSAVVAIAIGGFEAAWLVTEKLGLADGLWDAAGHFNESVKDLGFVIIGMLLAAWALSYLLHRLMPLRLADPVAGRAS